MKEGLRLEKHVKAARPAFSKATNLKTMKAAVRVQLTVGGHCR
jgi:hypothetical protein